MTIRTTPQPIAALEYSPTGQRPTRVRYQVMAFLGALSFLTYFDRVCIMRAQGEIQRDLGLSDTQMGWVLGAFWLAYGLFEIPIGWWGDRFGARRTLSRIVLAWSLFTALSGSATGFLSLLAFRFLFGLGEAGAYPNMARVQSRWLPLRSRARAGGMLWLMARWGGAFSPLIFGSMLRAFSHLEPIAHVAAWRMGFWASGLLGIFWVMLFYPWFRDDPAEKQTVNEAELALIRAGRPPQEQAHTTPSGFWPALFASRSLWALAMLYLCGSFGWSFFVSWMPRFLRDVHQVSFQRSELMNAMPLFFGGISCLVGGWLSDLVVKRTGWRRLGRGMFPVLGCTTAAMAMLGIRFVDTPAQAVALMCLAAAAFDFGQGANWATIVDIGGSYAGTATGFINMVGNMGNFIQPVVGALIFNHFGWPTLFVVYMGAYLVAATMWLLIDPTKKFHEHLAMPVEPRGFEVVRTNES
jgi:ACS family glucarate transporter-like MFS transporter